MLQEFSDSLDYELNESFLWDIVKWAMYFVAAIYLVVRVYGGDSHFFNTPGINLEKMLKKYLCFEDLS